MLKQLIIWVLFSSCVPVFLFDKCYSTDTTSTTSPRPIYETEFSVSSVIAYANSRGVDLFAQSKQTTEKQTFAYACNGNMQMLQRIIEAVKEDVNFLSGNNITEILHRYCLVRPLLFANCSYDDVNKDILKVRSHYYQDKRVNGFIENIKCDYRTLNTMAVLLFNTIAGNKKIEYRYSIPDMIYAAIITNSKANNKGNNNIQIDEERLDDGLSYLTGFIFYKMILNTWRLTNHWTFAQNFQDAFNSMKQYLMNSKGSVLPTGISGINNVSEVFTDHLKDILLQRLLSCIYVNIKQQGQECMLDKVIKDAQRNITGYFDKDFKCFTETGNSNQLLTGMYNTQKDGTQPFNVKPERISQNTDTNTFTRIIGFLCDYLLPESFDCDLTLKILRYISKMSGLVDKARNTGKIKLSGLGMSLANDISLNSFVGFLNKTCNIKIIDPRKLNAVCPDTGYNRVSVLNKKYDLRALEDRYLRKNNRRLKNFDDEEKFISKNREKVMLAYQKYYDSIKKKYDCVALRSMKNTEEVSDLINNIFDAIEPACEKKWGNINKSGNIN